MPVAEFSGFVLIKTKVNAGPHLEKALAKMQIRGGIVNGIHAQHQQSVNLASLHIGHQLFERFE